MLLSAMQLMNTTLTSPSDGREFRIELTKAVFPVPGDPEIYSIVGVSSSQSISTSLPENVSMNAFTMLLSCSLPAKMPVGLLHVARRRARARACMGMREGDGVGGGVARESWEIGRAEVDIVRRFAENAL